MLKTDQIDETFTKPHCFCIINLLKVKQGKNILNISLTNIHFFNSHQNRLFRIEAYLLKAQHETLSLDREYI